METGEPGWNQFRGPRGSGVAAGCRPPVEVGDATLAWKVPVPPGLSSPVIFGDRVFLTGIEGGRTLVTLALDRATGGRIWRRAAPATAIEKVHEVGSPASSTPHVDAERLYVYFGSCGLLCYDHDGGDLWQRPIPTPESLYGMTTSPVGHGGNLILVLDNDANLPDSKLSQSKIVAFSKSTGATVWETPRPFHRSGWSTPAVWEHDDGKTLVVLGNSRVTGYDPDSGAEQWFATGFSRETIALPVTGSGLVYVAAAQLGGGADEQPDPKPFWDAIMQFDTNRDGRLERGEMTGHFTYPLRPELPSSHPGYGIPLPSDPEKRRERLDGMLGWVDKNRDGYWSEEEWAANMASKRGNPLLLAIRPGGTGDVTETHVAWEARRNIPEIPSPLFHEKRLYMVRNGGLLAAVDATDGSTLYRERLAGSTGQYSASPVLADGHLYLASNRGLISVARTGDEYQLVHQHALGEPILVTPAIDASTIYFRSENHLWAFRRAQD